MSTIAIIQARIAATRLFGKVLAEAVGKPLLQHMIERLFLCKKLDGIIVAIPDTDENQPIVDLVAATVLSKGYESHLGWTRGSESDVLSRVLAAARSVQADLIVELTADCPLIDPTIVDRCVSEFLSDGCDFATTTLDAGDTGFPRGMDVRVFFRELLEEVDRLTQDPRDREHVSSYIWQHPERYRIHLVKASPGQRSNVRLTVDYPEDLELVRKIFEAFHPQNGMCLASILEHLEAYPELKEINAHVQQKEVR